MAAGGQGRGGDEEHSLLRDPRREFRVNFLKLRAHGDGRFVQSLGKVQLVNFEFMKRGARLCPQDKSQRVDENVLRLASGNVLRLVCDTGALMESARGAAEL